MILYTKILKLLQKTIRTNKGIQYSCSIQNWYTEICSISINNELSEREIKETISFTIASKRIKYVKINPTKQLKDLYSENYKTLIKESEDDTKKWKDCYAHGLEELILLKWPYSSRQPTYLMQSLSFFIELNT